MADIKRIPIAEFQQIGFLQEANRLFFHPHGLALEVTRVSEEDGGPLHSLSVTDAELAELHALVAEHAPDGTLSSRLDAAVRYDVGDAWLSGVWDYRDDPEGVVFGSWYGHDRDRVAAVTTHRERHHDARAALFGTDSDIEPIDWAYPEEPSDG